MSNEIVTRTIDTADKRLSLGNGQAVRLLEYLTTWTTVRLGIRLALNSPATLTGSPLLIFGMCSGTANGYADLTTDNFLGIASIATTWTYTGSPAYIPSVSFRVRKRITTTNTDHASVLQSPYIISEPTTNRSALIIQITKGSPNFTVELVAPTSSGGAQTDISDSTLVSMLEASTMAGAAGVVSGYAASGTSNGSMAIDEATNGYFNAINLFWDRSGAPIEFSDVRHRRVA